MRVATQTSSATLMVGLVMGCLAIAVVITNSCGAGDLAVLACERLRRSLAAFRLGMPISVLWDQSDWEPRAPSCPRERERAQSNMFSEQNKRQSRLRVESLPRWASSLPPVLKK